MYIQCNTKILKCKKKIIKAHHKFAKLKCLNKSRCITHCAAFKAEIYIVQASRTSGCLQPKLWSLYILFFTPVWASQMSELQSPPGYLTSWANMGPWGSLPKSTRKLGFRDRPPVTLLTSSMYIWQPSLRYRRKNNQVIFMVNTNIWLLI